MVRVLVLGVGLAAVATLSAAPANARPCASRDEIVSKLSTDLQQKQKAIGLTQAGLLAELFVSADGNWTIIFSTPEGFSCVMEMGSHWMEAGTTAPEV
jgi:hypothetical protein